MKGRRDIRRARKQSKERPRKHVKTFTEEKAGSTRARHLWAFRIASAIIIPAILLVAVEAALRRLGVLYPSEFTVPCTVAGRSAACDNERFAWQFFPYGMAQAPLFFKIPTAKPPSTFRIFVLGESAAEGDPEPSYSFARYVEVMLRERFPALRFEVINASAVAINSHVLVPIARDLAQRQGDLFIVYMGNNEVVGPYGTGTVLTRHISSLQLIRAAIFLRSTRIGQILEFYVGPPPGPTGWTGMEMFLKEQVSADAPDLKGVYKNFRTNLQDIIDIARRAGGRVLVSTVATNLRDSAPFASLHGPDLIPEKRSACEALCEAGLKLEGTGQWAEALKRYLSAAEIDDRYAEVHFGAGRCYWHLGDERAARERFARARDLDALRFRADSTINEIIRTTAMAAGPGVEFLDAEAALIGNGPQHIPGNDVFYDHVHLTPRGNYLLARAMFPRIMGMLPQQVRRSVTTTDEPASEEQCEQMLALTGYDRRRVAQDIVDRLGRPPFTNQSDNNERIAEMKREAAAPIEDPERADAAYRWAIARQPDDVFLHSNYGRLLAVVASAPDRSVEQLRVAIELQPDLLWARYGLTELLVQLGRLDEAIAQYRELIKHVPYYPDSYLGLVNALQTQGKFDDAIDTARRGEQVFLSYGLAQKAALLHQKAQELAISSATAGHQ